MNPNLIERLAVQAGFRLVQQAGGHNWIYTGSASGRCSEALERFAALVAEECAKQCDDNMLGRPSSPGREPAMVYRGNLGSAIRALFPPAP